MASISENRIWWEGYFKTKTGSEWSKDWGSIDMQWYGALLPRIHSLVPTGTILELAPGAGRWTQFLKDSCSHLILVDMSAEGIARCQSRFSDCSHISYHVNDGKSLSMIADESVDLVFSFNSLVHADNDAMAAYIAQFRSKLRRDGVGFIHHSNLAEYAKRYSAFSKVKVLGKHLVRLMGLKEIYLRSLDVSAETFREQAEASGLCCMSQEVITWRGASAYLDCLTMFTRRDSRLARPNKIFWNRDFRREIKYVAKLSDLYCYESIHKDSGFAAVEKDGPVSGG